MRRTADQTPTIAQRGASKLPVLIAILTVGVVALWWLWSGTSSQPDPSIGQNVATKFLKQLQQGQPDLAWDSTTAEFKSAQGKERFIREMKSHPLPKEPLEFVSTQTVEVQNSPRTEYLFRSASNNTVRILVGRDAGDWKVDRWTR